MKIMFLCPKCQKKLESDGEASGRKVKCPTCGQEMVVPNRELKPGVTLGGFCIVRKIGEGGMGEVFLARQKSLDRDVALKVLTPQLCRDKELVSRFFSEVKVLARLEHHGIVTAHEAGEDGGMFFLAMAFVPGHSLQEQIDKSGAFDEKTALRLVRKMAMALDYAWTDHKLLHRDIKPSNVLLDGRGEPKLVDFGLAKSIDKAEGLTVSGTVMGTPNYMSPEQVRGEGNLDFRADLYSLGATLFHMLTGKMPYAGSSIMETLQKQINEALPDPRTINPAVGKGCVMLLQKMLAKKQDQRPGSWKVLLGDVDRVLAGQEPTGQALKEGESVLLMRGDYRGKTPGSKRASSSGNSPKKWIGVAAAAGGLVVLAAGLTIWVKRRPPAGAPDPVPQAAAPAAVSAAPVAAVPTAAAAKLALEARVQEAAAVAAAQEKARLDVQARQAAEAAAKELAAREQVAKEAAAQEARAKEEAAKAAQLKAAQERFSARQAEVAGLLLKADFAGARENAGTLRYDAALAPVSAEAEALAALVDRIGDPDTVVLRSFEKNKGETVKVEGKTGLAVEMRVLGVSGGRVQTRQVLQGASVDRAFGPGDLSLRERLGRIGDAKTPEAMILRGLMLGVEGGDWVKAKQVLGEAGPGLGEALVAALQAKSASREEQAARQALGVILKTAALPADLNEPGRVMELLAAKPLSPENKDKVRAGVESFLKTYGNSEEAGVARALVEGLKGIDPEVAAKLELAGVFKLAGLTLDLEQTAALLDDIEARGFGKDAAKIQAAAAAFKRDHGKSEIGKQAAPLVAALAAAQEAAPVPFTPVPMLEATEENMKKALAALQAANKKATGISKAEYRVVKDGLCLAIHSAENIQDIRPLAGLPLKTLSLLRAEIKDFTPLTGMPLETLTLNNWKGDKLDSFPDLKELRSLGLSYSSIKSLLPFRRLKLKSLSVNNGRMDKLDGIEGFPLETLSIRNCPVEDLSLLAGKPLRALGIGSLTDPVIHDISVVKGFDLLTFELEGSSVKDLSPLAGKALNKIALYRSPISDLTPLAGMPLREVRLWGLTVTDLTPIKNELLQRLELDSLPVKELKPLVGCPLQSLRVTNMPKLMDAQNIPDYFPDIQDLMVMESLAKPELLNRMKNLKKLTVFAPGEVVGRVVPVNAIKK